MYLDSFDNLNSCNFEHFWLLWMFGTLLIGLIILSPLVLIKPLDNSNVFPLYLGFEYKEKLHKCSEELLTLRDTTPAPAYHICFLSILIFSSYSYWVTAGTTTSARYSPSWRASAWCTSSGPAPRAGSLARAKTPPPPPPRLVSGPPSGVDPPGGASSASASSPPRQHSR